LIKVGGDHPCALNVTAGGNRRRIKRKKGKTLSPEALSPFSDFPSFQSSTRSRSRPRNPSAFPGFALSRFSDFPRLCPFVSLRSSLLRAFAFLVDGLDDSLADARL
jgi:hypothetical protein